MGTDLCARWGVSNPVSSYFSEAHRLIFECRSLFITHTSRWTRLWGYKHSPGLSQAFIASQGRDPETLQSKTECNKSTSGVFTACAQGPRGDAEKGVIHLGQRLHRGVEL